MLFKCKCADCDTEVDTLDIEYKGNGLCTECEEQGCEPEEGE